MGVEPNLVARIRGIDFYFLNLSQLRQELVQVFRQCLLDAPQTIVRTAG